MTKKAIVRPLWGWDSNSPNVKSKIKNRKLLENTIQRVKNDIYNCDFLVYVFGKDNFEWLKSIDIACVLAHKHPMPYLDKHRFYLHRLDILDCALQDFDEVVLMNWNCRLKKELPENFWEELKQKEDLQCPLFKCSMPLASYRGRGARNKISSDTFIYCRDKSMPNEILKTLDWDHVTINWTPEACLSAYIDHLNGNKWIGAKKYFEKYEPTWAFHNQTIYREEKRKNACFTISKKNK